MLWDLSAAGDRIIDGSRGAWSVCNLADSNVLDPGGVANIDVHENAAGPHGVEPVAAVVHPSFVHPSFAFGAPYHEKADISLTHDGGPRLVPAGCPWFVILAVAGMVNLVAESISLDSACSAKSILEMMRARHGRW